MLSELLPRAALFNCFEMIDVTRGEKPSTHFPFPIG